MIVFISLIVFGAASYLFYRFALPFLFARFALPIFFYMSGIAGLAVSAAAIAVLIGLLLAAVKYFSAVFDDISFSHWYWPEDEEPARRSYFFGPGYDQLFDTILDAFSSIAELGIEICGIGIYSIEIDSLWGLLFAVICILYSAIAAICVFLISMIFCAVFSLIHASVTAVFMLMVYAHFITVWILDRVYLLKYKIRSDCPNCHSRFLIPAFMCPECGAIHKKLAPGPYGIWKHKCTCDNKIPATFLNGRSKLDAYCPDCASPLVASDARPVVFQLLGGSKAGKTVYLSAFFHKYIEKLSHNSDLKFTITDAYKPYFKELEKWYTGKYCPSTAKRNSQMYPILIDSSLGVKRQFSVYDIGGEMFDGFTADSEIQQQQFHYCDGLLFLLDPFSSGNLRTKKIAAGEDISDFSDMDAESVVSNFINYLIRTGHAKANSRCTIPIAVLIVKADITDVKRAIGPARIKSLFRKNPELYSTYEEARDSISRQFLIDIGLSSAVDNLETQFTNLHYFPVSAMGHSADGTPYEPWGIMDAIEWMLPLADKELSDLISPPATTNQ